MIRIMNHEKFKKYTKEIDNYFHLINDSDIYETMLTGFLKSKGYDLFDDEILQLREYLREKYEITLKLKVKKNEL
jgi:predicted transcriptional regulator